MALKARAIWCVYLVRFGPSRRKNAVFPISKLYKSRKICNQLILTSCIKSMFLKCFPYAKPPFNPLLFWFQTKCTLFRKKKRKNEGNDGLISYTDTKAKCRHLKKLTCKGTLGQVFFCLRTNPPLPGFCLGRSNNLVGSECGQILYIVLNSCRIEYGLQQNSTTLTPF